MSRLYRIPVFTSRLVSPLLSLVLASGLSVAQVAPPPAPPQVPAPAPISPPAPEMSRPSADASTGQQVELQAKPMLRVRGQSTWDDGFAELKKALKLLDDDAKRLGLAPVGQPKTHFIDSDDLGFTYEAYLPLAAEPAAGLAFSQGVAPGQSPAGRAMVFAHEGPYDDIDAAYEAITAFLDEKGLTATGKFLEEYLALPEKSDDPAMKLNIYVFLR